VEHDSGKIPPFKVYFSLFLTLMDEEETKEPVFLHGESPDKKPVFDF